MLVLDSACGTLCSSSIIGNATVLELRSEKSSAILTIASQSNASYVDEQIND